MNANKTNNYENLVDENVDFLAILADLNKTKPNYENLVDENVDFLAILADQSQDKE